MWERLLTDFKADVSRWVIIDALIRGEFTGYWLLGRPGRLARNNACAHHFWY